MKRKHLAAAALAATALIGTGAGIASAQTDDDGSTTTVVEDTEDTVTDDTVADDTATDDTPTDDTTTDDGSTEPGEARTRPDGAPEGCDEAGSGTASGSTEETPSSVVQP